MIPHYVKHVLKPLHFPFLMAKIKEKVYTPIAELKGEVAITKEPVSFENRLQLEFSSIELHEKWGHLFDCAWFHFVGKVPNEHKNNKIVLLIDLNGEGCLYDNGGNPVRGITNGSSVFDRELGEPCKRVVPFLDYCNGGEIVDIWIDAGNNDLFGNYQANEGLKQACIAKVDDLARDLYYDCLVLSELLSVVDDNSARFARILNAFNEVLKVLGTDLQVADMLKARQILKVELDKIGGDTDLQIYATGHSHLDLAWLWPIRETKRKAIRTVATQLELLDRYPEYIYNISQPQQLAWIKQSCPGLFAKIQEQVKNGRIELQGGSWVEFDTYMPSGESLVRQFIYGKKFVKENFDKDMDIMWLPDAFGYSAMLPQIMDKCGMKYFVTIKLSWSAIDIFPYHTFNWEGSDGTKVLAHMPPEGTYNGAASPKAVYKSEKEYIDKGLCDSALMLFGIGDGGGGASPKHLEMLKRMKNLKGIAPVKMDSADNFFKHIEKHKNDYKTYKGELYVQNHQGTLTSVAKVKYYNRLMERKLKEVEMLSSIAAITGKYKFPKRNIDEIWREMLLYQFHDILPGSSIRRVNEECCARYSIIENQLDNIFNDAHKTLANDVLGKTFYNTSPYKNMIEVMSDGIATCYSVQGLSNIATKQAVNSSVVYDNVMENDFIKVTFLPDGTIGSFFDKVNNFESVPIGKAMNQLVIYQDLGDAWDMSINYMQKQSQQMTLKGSNSFVNGNTAYRENVFGYGKSELIQTISLTGFSNLLKCDCVLNWQEKDKMLRVNFDVDIKTDKIKCDMQFGSYERAFGENTSWEYARFEFCAHKYVAIEQGKKGFAIINNCKYGHHASENFLSLNLVRAQSYPNDYFDIGEHKFSYGIMSFDTNNANLDVVKNAYNFNNPILALAGRTMEFFVAKTDNDSIVIESIKPQENGDGYVIRMYEIQNNQVSATIMLGCKFKSIYTCDLLENNLEQIDFVDDTVSLNFKPLEIKSIIVRL